MVGAPGPSHLGTRETANPNRTIPEFLTFRLYHRQLVSYHSVADESANTRTELQMNQICAKVVLPVS